MRILRLTSSPHAVAIGVAAGVACSWTPLVGAHFIISFLVTYLFAGDMIAAALGTAFGNPVTFPFLWAASWETGNLVLGNHPTAGQGPINLDALFHQLSLSELWGPILKPMLVGAIPLALLTGSVVYGVTFFGVRRFQMRRRMRLAAKAQSRMLLHATETASV